MAKTVFILGAGASKSAGAPLMSDFLEVAEKLLLTGKVPGVETSFKAILHARAELSSVHSKSQLQIHNVEDVFSAIEMANTLKKLGDYPQKEIVDLVKAMKAVIVNTIEETVAFPFDGRHSASAPAEYADFARLLVALRDNTIPKADVAVITFNYDMALDYALFKEGIQPFYGFESDPAPEQIPLFKLHGSLNWGKCAQCDEIFPVYIKEYTDNWGVPPVRSSDGSSAHFSIGTSIATRKHPVDGASALPEPVVIPPTWNKSGQYEKIANVWARAAQELGSAENIFIIGYSLPDSDSFFRYLYALGTASKRILKRIWIFNPDESVKEKFRQLLGPGALQSFDYPLPPEQSTFWHSQDLIRRVIINGEDLASAKKNTVKLNKPSWLLS